ncbi:MAG: hypothetical protein LAP87_08475 [Acidobacteriia bacterium]|nr:hypothetical protein [Terriglobia bacterium]
MNNPRNIWQSQPTEPFKMSTDEIRRKAQQLQRKARLGAVSWITIGLFLCVGFARTFARTHEVVPRIGWGLLSLWGIYGAYQAYKWIWPGKLPLDATVGTSLEFYRSELERQRDYVQHVWRRAGLTFCFLGLAIVLVPALIQSLGAPRLLRNAVPFSVLAAIWFAIFWPTRKRAQQKLQQEIEELRLSGTENRS